MPAPSKTFSALLDAAIAARKPLDQALMTALRDNLVHLEEWLGHSYAAEQNHNHDGVNSALIEIGPNYVRNSGFEDGLTGWTQSTYTGGSIAINTSNDMEGQQAAAITSSSTANGGGYLQTAQGSVGAGVPLRFAYLVRAAGANVSHAAQVLWFNKAGTQISSTTIGESSNTPTTATLTRRSVIAPALARSWALRLTGGVPGVGSSAGTIYFDAAFAGTGLSEFVQAGDLVLLAEAGPVPNGESTGGYSKYYEVLCGFAGVVRVKFTVENGEARIYVNGAAVGMERSSSPPATFSEDITVNSSDLLQIYTKRTGGIVTLTGIEVCGALPIGFSQILP